MKALITSIFLLILSINAMGQAEAQKESLRGLKGVYVKILPVTHEFSQS